MTISPITESGPDHARPGTNQSITPDELRLALAGGGLSVIDVRPLIAYNGWTVEGVRRRPRPRRRGVPRHVARVARARRGRRAARGERRPSGPADRRLRRGRGRRRSASPSGSAPDGFEEVRQLTGGWSAWLGDPDRPIEIPPRLPQLVHPDVASGDPRRRASGGRARRARAALPRELRRPRGVRGGPPARRPLPRHELAGGPGRLEPPLAGGARRGRPVARHHAPHDRHPLRPRHRGRRQREVAGPPGRPDRRHAGGPDPDATPASGTSASSTAAMTAGSATGNPLDTIAARAIARRRVRGLDPAVGRSSSSTSTRRRRSSPTRTARPSSASGPGGSTSAR